MAEHLETRFLTTQWTRILSSGKESTDSASQALVILCESYHYPVYAFIRNRCGDAEKARDLSQGFFEFLIEKKLYLHASAERGRFRSFLLSAVKNYLNNEHRNATRQKRAGGKHHFSIELGDFDEDLVSDVPSEILFDREWASTIFKRAWKFLRSEYEQIGQLDRFEMLRPIMINPGEPFPYQQVAEQLKLTESGVKSTVFRLKNRFREIFRATVAQVVDHPDEVDQEIEYLIQAMSQPPQE